MGQKVNPKIIRIKIINDWSSKWFASKKKYIEFFHKDLKIREFLFKIFTYGTIGKIDILRQSNKVTINIFTSKPGLIIGKAGGDLEELKIKLKQKFNAEFSINVMEIKNSYLYAKLIAENIAHQIERRLPYRRVVKAALAKAKEEGVKGIKVGIGGRLNGVEIARSETFLDGTIPLHTFRADIDYSSAIANTKYGVIGIKVWIYKGDVFNKKENAQEAHK